MGDMINGRVREENNPEIRTLTERKEGEAEPEETKQANQTKQINPQIICVRTKKEKEGARKEVRNRKKGKRESEGTWKDDLDDLNLDLEGCSLED